MGVPCASLVCVSILSASLPTICPSEFQMINENPAPTRVTPLEVGFKETKTKTYSMSFNRLVWFLIWASSHESLYRLNLLKFSQNTTLLFSQIKHYCWVILLKSFFFFTLLVLHTIDIYSHNKLIAASARHVQCRGTFWNSNQTEYFLRQRNDKALGGCLKIMCDVTKVGGYFLAPGLCLAAVS